MRRMLLVCLLLALFSLSITAADHQAIVQNGVLQVTPASIGYPEYTYPAVKKHYTLTLKNTGPITITVPYATAFEDSIKPSTPLVPGWLGYGALPPTILPGDSATVTLTLNEGGVVTYGPRVLYGKLRFYYGPSGDSLDLPIHFTVADTIVFPVWDTIITQCGIPLTVGTNGNLGAHGIGGANLNFPKPSPECDTGGNNPGNADIYLADASPVVVRRVAPGNYVGSWSLHNGDITSPNGFKPLFPGGNRGYFSAARWQGFITGTFCTVDSLVKIERTYWAPSGATNADSCHFVIMRTRYWPYTINQSVSNLAIGDAFDWDVPSDSGEILNVAGTDPTRRLVYMRGFDAADTGEVCYTNSRRYAGAALIAMHLKNCVQETSLYGGFNAANDSLVYPASGFIPEQLWANMQATGYSNESRVTDLHSVLAYKNGPSNVGYTLPANDTLTIWTAVAVVRPTGGSTAQGLDSLKREIDKAFKWYVTLKTCVCGSCCCIGTRGNVNKSPAEAPDLSDLSYMISNLISSPNPIWPCFDEADINGDGKVDLSDLSWMIAYLTTEPRPTLPNCP